jgi:hypothetical protein
MELNQLKKIAAELGIPVEQLIRARLRKQLRVLRVKVQVAKRQPLQAHRGVRAQ